MELTNPRRDPATATLTYDVALLADAERPWIALAEQPVGGSALPAQFGPAHLFIDDCPAAKIECWLMQGSPAAPTTYLGDLPPDAAAGGPWPYCFDPSRGCCSPCRWSSAGLASFCQEEFPDCIPGLCRAVSPAGVAGECGVL